MPDRHMALTQAERNIGLRAAEAGLRRGLVEHRRWRGLRHGACIVAAQDGSNAPAGSPLRSCVHNWGEASGACRERQTIARGRIAAAGRGDGFLPAAAESQCADRVCEKFKLQRQFELPANRRAL